jgi:hypothetical protein
MQVWIAAHESQKAKEARRQAADAVNDMDLNMRTGSSPDIWSSAAYRHRQPAEGTSTWGVHLWA